MTDIPGESARSESSKRRHDPGAYAVARGTEVFDLPVRERMAYKSPQPPYFSILINLFVIDFDELSEIDAFREISVLIPLRPGEWRL
jgi:hypothetical protein